MLEVENNLETSQDFRTLVTEGISLLDAGDKLRALPYFVTATHLQPGDEKLWLLRAEATSDPKEALECLERVLEINPENAQARERLVLFQVNSLQEEARETTQVIPRSQFGTGLLGSNITLGRFGMLVIAFALLFGVLSSLLVIAAVLFSVTILQKDGSISSRTLPPPTMPAVVLPPTWTPQPTPTALPPFMPAPPPTWRITRDVTVRAGPSVSFESLGLLKQDQRVSVVGQTKDGKYLQIEYPDPSRFGWVLTDYVEIGNDDRTALAIVTNVPTPKPVQPIVVKPSPKSTNTPAPLFDFDLGRPAMAVADCNKQTGVLGTVYANRSNGIPLNGVLVRITAFGQVQGIAMSGSKGQAGYWEWYFTNGMDIVGDATVVKSDGSPSSQPVGFRLTPCSVTSNQMVIDFVGTR